MTSSLLSLPASTSCKIHPVVTLSILDHWSRRNAGLPRVIGVLLGGLSAEGVVDIRNSFALPHSESENNVQLDLAVETSFLELHSRVNAAEVVVGWYSTTTKGSTEENDLKIHNHLTTLCASPIHLTVDTLLTNDTCTLHAFIGQNMTVSGNVVGVFFQQIQVQTKSFEAERIGVDFITKATLRAQEEGSVSSSAPLSSNLESLEGALTKMVGLLEEVLGYTRKVLKNETPADDKVGRFLAETIAAVPHLEPAQLEALLHGSMEDLLMVVYLGSLTRTQLALAQKLNSAI